MADGGSGSGSGSGSGKGYLLQILQLRDALCHQTQVTVSRIHVRTETAKLYTINY